MSLVEDRLLADVESIVVFHLKADADVDAIVDRRVSTKLERTFPAVTVKLIGGRMAVEDFLAAPTLQIDSWATTKAEARTLAYVVERSCRKMRGTHAPYGVVAGTQNVLLPREIAEETAERAHYASEIRVFVRPL